MMKYDPLRFEKIVAILLISIALSVFAWKLVDNFIINVSFLESLFIELIFVSISKFYIFISRRVLSASRD